MRFRTTRQMLAVTSTVLALAGGASVYALTSNHTAKPTAPAVSDACQVAANAQNRYAQLADQQGYLTTYTNAQMLTATQIDAVLVGNMIKAGCPQNIRYYDMTTGTWEN